MRTPHGTPAAPLAPACPVCASPGLVDGEGGGPVSRLTNAKCSACGWFFAADAVRRCWRVLGPSAACMKPHGHPGACSSAGRWSPMTEHERAAVDLEANEARSELDEAISRFGFAVTCEPPWPELLVLAFACADLLFMAERWARDLREPAGERFRATKEGRRLYGVAERAGTERRKK